MAIAPASTLKRMYHCVPISISRTEPNSSPLGTFSRKISRTGKSAVAGMEATTCTTGCRRRDQRGERPMATPTGTVQAAPMSIAVRVRPQVAKAAGGSPLQAPWGTFCSSRIIDQRPKRTSTPSRRRHNRPTARRTTMTRERWPPLFSGDEVVRQWLEPIQQARGQPAQRAKHPPVDRVDQRRAVQCIEHEGVRGLGATALLQLELVGPGDHGAPEELVEQHDEQDEGEQAA